MKEKGQTSNKGRIQRHDGGKQPPEHGGNLKENLDKELFFVPSFFTFPIFPLCSIVFTFSFISSFHFPYKRGCLSLHFLIFLICSGVSLSSLSSFILPQRLRTDFAFQQTKQQRVKLLPVFFWDCFIPEDETDNLSRNVSNQILPYVSYTNKITTICHTSQQFDHFLKCVTPLSCLTLRLLMSYIYMERPFLKFLDHTQRRSTVGRTPLDE